MNGRYKTWETGASEIKFTPYGTVMDVRKIGYKRYEVAVETLPHSRDLFRKGNGVAFERGAHGIVIDKKFMSTTVGNFEHYYLTGKSLDRLTIVTGKKKNQINVGDKVVVIFNAFQE